MEVGAVKFSEGDIIELKNGTIAIIEDVNHPSYWASFRHPKPDDVGVFLIHDVDVKGLLPIQ